MLVGDAVRLRAALENLIDNAVKFTERGAVRIDVRAARAPRGRVKLVFTVTDSGIGLTPAEIKRLFRPFTQANADIARRYGGTGLGLAVVKALAKLMGGDLSITSKRMAAARRFVFRRCFRVAAADEAGNTRERRRGGSGAARSPSFASRTILTAGSFSTPFSPSSAIAPTSPARAKKRSTR